ncbi:MarR family winged helix-turn-helix transcriptional regulator [Agromyces sp. LHK192]|uniref:MarR family winged helix-turn-helix transcriptional regulator n=1 Tax=Agromyces sp. LHK192 TaxID=2498704 RepID=UPI000FDA6630|nr:MarR family transcriptional regulator [Agromyces sp. LHK192]
MSRTLDSVVVARISSLVPTLRRSLLRIARSHDQLPEIPETHVEVLRLLVGGETRSPGEIAAILRLSRPTISNLLRAMEEGDLVERRTADHNHRQVEVRASRYAMEVYARFQVISTDIVALALEELTDEDIEAIEDALPALEHLRDHVRARARALDAEPLDAEPLDARSSDAKVPTVGF